MLQVYTGILYEISVAWGAAPGPGPRTGILYEIRVAILWSAAPGPGHGIGILYKIRVIDVGRFIPGPGYSRSMEASLQASLAAH